jgi:acetyl esterase/lipase
MSLGEPQCSGGPAVAPQLDWLNGDVALLRDAYRRQRTRPIPENAGWLTIGGVRVLAHRAAGSKTAIVYFHGGGFIVGSPLTHADITQALRLETGLPLYSVDYRLAPEHVAPAPVEDGIAVVRQLIVNGVERVVLCGDSAGGTIALALEAGLPAALRPHVAGVCCFYGAYGAFDTPSLLRNGSRTDGTDAACVMRYFDLAGGREAYSISTLAGSSTVPIYLLAADGDPLRDDSILLAQALRRNGRHLVLDTVPDVGHGFLHQAGMLPSAGEAIGRAAAWMSSLSQ